MENTEIEIKVNVENSKPLIDFLEKNGKFKYENHQIDEYFSPAHRDFTKVRPVAEWLRLRNSNGKYSINYKNWHTDKEGRSYHCDEYETEFDDLDKVKNIFHVLNFRNLIIVDKVRKVWEYKDYEIGVDSVKNLGDFVEIEYHGKSKVGPKEVTKGMVDFLKSVGVGKIKRNFQGYPFMMLFPNEVKFEEQ